MFLQLGCGWHILELFHPPIHAPEPCSAALHRAQLPRSHKPHLGRGCEEVERPGPGAVGEGDAAVSAGEYEQAVAFSIFACGI